MKKLYILIAALMVILLTSMMLVEKNDNQQAMSLTLENKQPMLHKGVITIKLKARSSY